ncbi:MAG: polysaccharide biosynthesis tyrosine autokinase [Chloroflexia bacterium]
MEIRRYFAVLRRWWWLLAAAVLVASGSSYLATRSTPRTYRTRARVLVGESIQSRNPDWASINTAQQLALTYAELATTRPVLQSVIDRLGLQASPEVLREMIAVKLVQGTQILDVVVVDTDPVRGAAIANALAEEMIRQGPGGSESPEASIRRDVEEQLLDLRQRIDFAKQEIQNLEDQMLQEDSARAIAELKNRRDLLQQQIAQWQNTYAQLYAAYTGNQANKLTVVERAEPSYTPVGPRTALNVALAALIGGQLAVGAVVLLEYLDDTVKNGDELAQLTQIPFLGIVPRMRESNELAGLLITLRHPRSSAAESFRVLRTNLQFSSLDRPLRTLLITSPQPTEGKSTVAANLGVVFAQAGQRVILVDSDLRRPVLHRFFEVSNELGLTGALFANRNHAQNGLVSTSVENLFFLPSGPLPPNPAEIIASQRMELLLERLQEEADIVILDSPPVLTVADASILAARVDGVVLVADCGVTQRAAVRKAAESLRQVGARLLGSVLNRVDTRADGYYYYYYYYYRSGYGTEEERKVRRKRKRRQETRDGSTPNESC